MILVRKVDKRQSAPCSLLDSVGVKVMSQRGRGENLNIALTFGQ